MPWMCDFIEWAQRRSTPRFKICLPFPSLHGLNCVLLEFTQSTAPQCEPQQQLPRDATYSHVLNQISKTVGPLVLQKTVGAGLKRTSRTLFSRSSSFSSASLCLSTPSSLLISSAANLSGSTCMSFGIRSVRWGKQCQTVSSSANFTTVAALPIHRATFTTLTLIIQSETIQGKMGNIKSDCARCWTSKDIYFGIRCQNCTAECYWSWLWNIVSFIF